MRGLELTSSMIVSRALGLRAEGVAAKSDGICALCGAHIAEGDLCAPFKPSGAFMDDLSLAGRGSDVICGHCEPLTHVEALRASGYGAFGADGTKPLRKWADVRVALLEPPQPPFVMVYATANNQHMAWRAPVNFSRDIYMVRVGLRNLLIRRQMLVKAVDDCAVLADALGLQRNPAAATLPHPFVSLSPDLKDPVHGVLRPSAFSPEFLEKASAQQLAARDALLGLSLGETWALRFVLTNKSV